MRRALCCLIFALFAASTAFAFPSWVQVGIGSHEVRWRGGSGTLSVAGTFGGTTVTFFYCAPLTKLTQCFEVDATACTFTAAGTCDFFKGPGDLQLVVAGGTPSITAVAAGPTQASASGIGGDGGGGSAVELDFDQDGTANVFQEFADNVEFDFDDDGVTDLRMKKPNATTLDFLAIGGINNLRFAPAGTALAGVFVSGLSHGPSIGTPLGGAWRDLVPSEIVPTAVMLSTDLTTGLGYSTEGGIAIIDNTVMAANFTSTFVAISSGLTFAPPPSASPPITCAAGVEGHLYDDTDQDLLCRCDGVTWAGVGGGATCT